MAQCCRTPDYLSFYSIVAIVDAIVDTIVVTVVVSVITIGWDGADGQVACVRRGWMATGAEEGAAER